MNDTNDDLGMCVTALKEKNAFYHARHATIPQLKLLKSNGKPKIIITPGTKHTRKKTIQFSLIEQKWLKSSR